MDLFSKQRILAVGAHPDDIELGCFGALLRFQSGGSRIAMCVLSDGERGGNNEHRTCEAQASSRLVDADLTLAHLPDTSIPEGHPTIGIIEDVIKRFRPTVVFVNSPNDTHQAHRSAARATLSAARFVPHIFFYQTPSSTRSFVPQVFVDISDVIEGKLKATAIHESQVGNSYMADRTVKRLAEFLGLQVYRVGHYFEGFESYHMIIINIFENVFVWIGLSRSSPAGGFGRTVVSRLSENRSRPGTGNSPTVVRRAS